MHKCVRVRMYEKNYAHVYSCVHVHTDMFIFMCMGNAVYIVYVVVYVGVRYSGPDRLCPRDWMPLHPLQASVLPRPGVVTFSHRCSPIFSS